MKHLFRLTIFSLLASAFPVQAEEPDISGKWKFEPKPERVIRDNYFKTLGRSFTLEFRKNAEGEWEVTGDPFGIKMTEFDLDDAEAGGDFDLKTTYTVSGGGREKDFDIDWDGDITEDGTRIEGKFRAYIGRGEFIATKIE